MDNYVYLIPFYLDGNVSDLRRGNNRVRCSISRPVLLWQTHDRAVPNRSNDRNARMMQSPGMTVYGALWCPDCHRSK